LKISSVKIISFLWLGTLTGSAIGFFVQVVLARTLGAEIFGLFTATISTINLIMPLAGFGIAAFWLKVFGQEGWDAMRWLPSSFLFVLISTSLVIATTLVWAAIGPHDPTSNSLLRILSLMVLGNLALELLKSKLQLEENYVGLAVWQITYPLLKLGVLFCLILFGASSAKSVSWGFSVLSITICILGIFPLLNMLRGEFYLKGHGSNNLSNGEHNLIYPSMFDIWKESWVFGFAGMFYIVWSTSNIVLLKYLAGDKDAGFYGVSILVINAICILPNVIYSKYLMPKIHRWSSQDISKLREVYILGNKVMLIIGCLMMASLFLFSTFMIELIFGHEFSESANILIILAITLPIKFVGHSVGALLVAKDNMLKKVKVMGTVAVLNVVMNIVAIPNWGVYGVAATSVISELILLTLYYLLVKKVYLDTNWFQNCKN
jgi:O-antigen/teichoic acid export membrane protein